MMDESDIIEYSKAKGFFLKSDELYCSEIGDGNVNYVFRVTDSVMGKSIIIKHAKPLLRYSGEPLGVDRNRIEAGVLEFWGKLVPEHVPKVYMYDNLKHCIVMQDLVGYENMRYALIKGKTFPTFAEDISTFMAETLIRTTDIILVPMEKKLLCKNFINPEMCQISEKLIFTEPYTNYHGSNVLFEENIEFFRQELYNDIELCIEAAKLKENFKSNAQALIHGDLHTGSIFINESSTMVIDPEFAFYGPIGYDVGNVIANLIFTWIRAEVATHDDLTTKEAFQNWVETSIIDTIDLFYKKSLIIIKEEANERMASFPGFAEWYMGSIMCDTAGMAGMELNRRIIGKAKVKDISGIEDRNLRKIAERICVLCAKQFILNRNNKYQVGRDYIDTLYEVRNTLNQLNTERI